MFSRFGVMLILESENRYFRVFILGKECEFPWFGSVLVNELKEFFHINCDVCMHYFREILGSETFYSMWPQVFFPSHILSYLIYLYY